MDAIPPGLHRSSPAELKARLDAERRGTPFLVFRDGDRLQHVVELTADRSPLGVGRQPTSAVALTWDDEVSRAHADIECIGEVWTLVDDGRSRNGSFVNGERVHGRRALRHGDVLAVGRTRLTYVAPLTGGDGSTAVGARGSPPGRRHCPSAPPSGASWWRCAVPSPTRASPSRLPTANWQRS